MHQGGPDQVRHGLLRQLVLSGPSYHAQTLASTPTLARRVPPTCSVDECQATLSPSSRSRHCIGSLAHADPNRRRQTVARVGTRPVLSWANVAPPSSVTISPHPKHNPPCCSVQRRRASGARRRDALRQEGLPIRRGHRHADQGEADHGEALLTLTRPYPGT